MTAEMIRSDMVRQGATGGSYRTNGTSDSTAITAWLVEHPSVRAWWAVLVCSLSSLALATILGFAWYTFLQPSTYRSRGSSNSRGGGGGGGGGGSSERYFRLRSIGNGYRSRMCFTTFLLLIFACAWPPLLLYALGFVPPTTPVCGLVVFVVGSGSLFKSLEIIAGTTAPGVLDYGLEFWLLYFVSPVEPRMSAAGRPVRAPPPHGGLVPVNSLTLRLLGEIAGGAAALWTLLSYGRAVHFAPASWIGNQLYAGLTWSLAISQLMAVARCVVSDFGYEPGAAFRWPYFYSRSAPDFWGARLDLAFQGMLKRSFYYPVRALSIFKTDSNDSGGAVVSRSHTTDSSSGVHNDDNNRSTTAAPRQSTGNLRNRASPIAAAMAAIVTFTASGLVHEVMWWAVHVSLRSGDTEARLGANAGACTGDGWTTAYFVVQGVMCSIAVAAGQLITLLPSRRLAKLVPGPLRLYFALVTGPLVGLPWYLARLHSCGYWEAMSELYLPLSIVDAPGHNPSPVAQAAASAVARILPANGLFGGFLPREVALHFAGVCVLHALWPARRDVKKTGRSQRQQSSPVRQHLEGTQEDLLPRTVKVAAARHI